MKRARQEFFMAIKSLCWAINGICNESNILTSQEQDIWFEGVTKLRSLEDKLKKEYNKTIKKEQNDKTKKDARAKSN